MGGGNGRGCAPATSSGAGTWSPHRATASTPTAPGSRSSSAASPSLGPPVCRANRPKDRHTSAVTSQFLARSRENSASMSPSPQLICSPEDPDFLGFFFLSKGSLGLFFEDSVAFNDWAGDPRLPWGGHSGVGVNSCRLDFRPLHPRHPRHPHHIAENGILQEAPST